MRFLCVAALCAAGASLSAETRLDISQLAGTITSALAVDRNDKRIARSLKNISLTERLTPEVCALIISLGVGPETARVLDTLQKRSRALKAPSEEPLSVAPEPPDAQQQTTAAMRKYVSEYLRRFPDFIATKAVHQYHNFDAFGSYDIFQRNKTLFAIEDRWYAAAAYTTEAAHAGGRDYHKNTASGYEITRISIDEFGGMLEEIFDPKRGEAFHWERAQMLDSIRTAVFSYRVAPGTSGYGICCQPVTDANGITRRQYLKAGHRGFVFADQRSGAVLRLIMYATGLTEAMDINAAGHVLDYGEIHIGGNRYLLPVHSTAYVRVGKYEWREEIVYRNHRKFTSEAAIQFVEDGDPPRSRSLPDRVNP